MRRLLTVVGVMLALVTPSAVFAQAIRVYVDQQPVNFDVPPVLIQGRVLVPLRGIFERLGATVDYDAPTQHIVAIRGQQNVELTVGSRQAHVNGIPKLLDVPAFTINNRTMVPLRFISESLGADVRWDDATQTIFIGGGVAGGPAAPPPGPAQAAGALSGRIVAVTTGQNPSIIVRRGGQDTTVSVTADTAIYRYNADTNAGGSAALGALRKGDTVAVQLDGSGQAAKITATYRVVSGGRIASVGPGNRTVTLANGQSYVVLTDAQISLNGQSAGFDAIQPGRNGRFFVVQGTNQAYEVNVTTPAAQPAPTVLNAPAITSPTDGAKVGNAMIVTGMAQPGATVVVRAEPRLLGQAVQATTTADGAGRWRAALNVQSLPMVSFPYVISAIQILNGTQSDATSIQVSINQ
ncbi:MAG TPA: copper amine oxidase N-terminal domain-containing protein [bacterium]|nr:copper amine oxidase N-terminal domain-containing protein [bacterium]